MLADEQLLEARRVLRSRSLLPLAPGEHDAAGRLAHRRGGEREELAAPGEEPGPLGAQTPRPFPMISFMISFAPP